MAENNQIPGVGSLVGALAPNIDNLNLSVGELPSLVDYGREPSVGAWPKDWYNGIILAGYATGSGHQFITEDKVSKDGDSRNLIVCFQVVNAAGETRNIFAQLNYRVQDFDPKRLATIQTLRKHFASQKGAWGAKGSEEANWQRSSIAIGQLGQFEKALGFKLSAHPAGLQNGLNVVPFTNQRMDVHLGINDKGFNEVTEFAKFNERVGQVRGKKKA